MVRENLIVLRNDCYKIEDTYLKLPKGLKLRIKGEPKWHGKQGRLEVTYDEVDEVWRGFMAIKVEEPPKKGGSRSLYIDLGVRCLAAVWCEGMRQPIAFRGGEPLFDWWYWTGRMAREQSRTAKVNGAKTSKKLRGLFRIRQRRFRHAVNAMVKAIVEDAYRLGVSRIVLGNLKGIRENNHSRNVNSMINNFWSFEYIVRRLKEKAEEYGIKVEEVSEYKASSICPRCGSDRTIKRGRLFKCLNCGLEAHRDAVGVLNIGYLQGEGSVNGVVAHPLLLRWDGMMWEPKRAMNTRPMKTLEAGIPRL